MHKNHQEITALLKSSMRNLPAGVALVTSRDPQTGIKGGMAASSVISVTMDPPSMLVAVNRSASTHAIIKKSKKFCINLLDVAHRDLVTLFSSPDQREERFSHPDWQELHEMDYYTGATNIFCNMTSSLVTGTHEIFIGEVFDIHHAEALVPLGWMAGGFHQMHPLV